MAPEVLTGLPLDEKADVYSYGIVLWELFTQTEPYEDHTQYKGFVKAVCQLNERPPIPSYVFYLV
jgi:serine/threonine protein kinase